MALFQKSVHGHWASDSVDWSRPLELDSVERSSLARLLTPVYVGEQTAMAGASAVLLHLTGSSRNAAHRLFLVSFSLDEARHFEVLTRFYEKIERRPLEVRELKQMLRYHAALLRARHPVPWMWGILVSDIFAKHFYGTFYRAMPESLFGELSARILVDESRHQAFAEHFLGSAQLDTDMQRTILGMRDELLDLMRQMHGPLRSDIDTLGYDGGEFFDRLTHDVETKLVRLGILEGTDTGAQHDEDEAELLTQLAAVANLR